MREQINKEEPLISVIIPVYKVEKYLRKCLDSIRAQTYTNLEIILIDDASPDSSGKICDLYARQDGRFQVVHLDKNQGVSHARNVGIGKAAGDFISFIDPDDYVESVLFERLYENLVENQADVSVCRIDRIGFGKYKDSWKNEFACVASSVQAVTYMLSGCHFDWGVCFGKLFSGSLVKKYPFAEQIYCGEDILFMYRLFHHICRASYLPERLYHYIYREDSAIHGGFSARRYTELQVFEFLCKDIKKKVPRLVPQIENYILTINIKLAVKAVESKTAGGRRLYLYLRKFRRNIRRYISFRSLRLFEDKKIVAEVILLYVSIEGFWMITALYKGLKRLKPLYGRFLPGTGCKRGKIYD